MDILVIDTINSIYCSDDPDEVVARCKTVKEADAMIDEYVERDESDGVFVEDRYIVMTESEYENYPYK